MRVCEMSYEMQLLQQVLGGAAVVALRMKMSHTRGWYIFYHLFFYISRNLFRLLKKYTASIVWVAENTPHT